MGKKVLLDTSILIPFYNQGRFSDKLLAYTANALISFCSVSINEFIRGAHNSTSKEIISGLLEIAGNSTVNPSLKQWIECGKISEKILKQKRRNKNNVLLLQNDILIALCTRDENLILVTADQADFRLIQNYVDVSIEYWSH